MKSNIKFYRSKIVIPTKKGEVACYYRDLMYVKFKTPYCWLYFFGSDKYLVKISLTSLLRQLPEKPFFRCNRTEVINLCYYWKYSEDSASLIMEDGTEFCLSVRSNKGFAKKKDSLKFFSPPCPNCSDCKKERCRGYWLFSLEPEPSNNG